jgi:iron complex transport system substrate-binding protein
MIPVSAALTWLVLLTATPAALLDASPGAVTYRDMRGREVTLPGPPQRIVSLVPSLTELIFALGAEQRLVGRTDFCDYPPAAREKPSVGGMVAPSLETIVALKADLVLATNSGNREETVAQLDRLRIPTYVVNANRVSEVKDVIARLGELTGRLDAVSPLIARLDGRIAAVQKAVAPFAPPRVLYVVWPEPLIVPGRDAIVTELIGLAGGRSITAEFRSDYPRVSLEAALAAAPEVILLASQGSTAGSIPREKWQRFASLPAVKTGRLHPVHGDLLHRYGPRMLDGLEQMARALHPEAFR